MEQIAKMQSCKPTNLHYYLVYVLFLNQSSTFFVFFLQVGQKVFICPEGEDFRKLSNIQEHKTTEGYGEMIEVHIKHAQTGSQDPHAQN
jgi:hypothetical protein